MRLVKGIVRHMRLRPRLSGAILLGIGLVVLLPRSIWGPTRALLAWDLGAGTYLGLAWLMMVRSDIEKIRWRARIQDDGAAVILALTVVASIASLAAIVLELMGIRGLPPRTQTAHLALATITILCSWCVVHTAFALHYAHEFYDDARKGRDRCLNFPGEDQPDYSISCTSRSCSGRPHRRRTSRSNPARCGGSRSCTASSHFSSTRRCWR